MARTMGTMWLTASLSCLIYLLADEGVQERQSRSMEYLEQLI